MTTTIPPDLRAKLGKSSFYAGMRVLPKPQREGMFAIYGFCRAVDDIADDIDQPRPERAQALAGWREAIHALYASGDAGQAAFLAAPVRRFALAEADFQAVIAGMAMDVEADIRWPEFASLDTYCDHVASAVGRLAVRVFGMEEGPGLVLAHHLGRALQFTNILRDIDEDASLGRVYLPAEALSAAGITPSTPAALLADARLDTAARWLATHAEAHFAAAMGLLKTRPAGRLLPPRLMAAGYARLLRAMLSQGWAPPRRRLRVARWRLVPVLLGLAG